VLESRWCPATLVSPTKVTWQDVDGDIVTCKLSRPLLTADTADSVFAFSIGTVNGDNSVPQVLTSLNLFSLGGAASGLSVTIKASQVGTGDGFVNVGAIEAVNANGKTRLDLGTVTVHGDLEHIDAGDDTTTTPGLAALTVNSLGRFDPFNQIGSLGLTSTIKGSLGALTVQGDVDLAFVNVTSGSIGSVTIRGSVIGNSANNSGVISCDGNMGAVKVGGSVVGAGGLDSGRIHCNGRMRTVTIGGSVIGGSGELSGLIQMNGNLAGVSIKGNIEGGGGNNSGQLSCTGASGPVSVGGSLQGGTGANSGQVFTAGAVASLSLGGSVIGGGGVDSGEVFCEGSLGSVRIKGDIRGDTGPNSGELHCKAQITGPVVVRGSLVGGSGDRSGLIEAEGVVGLGIGGDVRGGSGSSSGSILGIDTLTSVTVGGSVWSGTGSNSGQISSNRALGSVVIKGDIIGTRTNPEILTAFSGPGNSPLAIQSVFVGGRVEFSEILAGFDESLTPLNPDAQIGRVTVGGDWIASSISAGIDPKNGTFGDIDDQLITGKNDPNILAKIGSIKIGGALLGTPVFPNDIDTFGFEAEQIGSVSIGGVVLPLQAGPHNDIFSLGDTRTIGLLEL
jgi:hypothetical protein